MKYHKFSSILQYFCFIITLPRYDAAVNHTHRRDPPTTKISRAYATNTPWLLKFTSYIMFLTITKMCFLVFLVFNNNKKIRRVGCLLQKRQNAQNATETME